MLSQDYLDQIVEAVKELPVFEDMGKVVAMMPKIRQVIAHRDAQKRRPTMPKPMAKPQPLMKPEPMTPPAKPVERYSKEMTDRAVRYCCLRRQNGENPDFRTVLENVASS